MKLSYPFGRIFAILLMIMVIILVFPRTTAGADVNAQDANPTSTKVILTVTGTPIGIYIVVNSDNDQINVRECPNATTCSKVGVLLAGQKVPAKGRTEGGEWIEIVYPGVPTGLAWVHSSLVSLYGGSLPVVEPPATPTPAMTSTINPTLAAQFIVTIQPSRLPTFTQPAPLSIPTFEANTSNTNTTKVPVGMLIVGLLALGIFGSLLSVLQGR
jgi:hypothetical protein